MKPPTRLLSDESIEPDLRAALQSEASREVPFDVSAGLERLQGAIAAGAPASSLAWKLKLLLGGGTGVAIAALVGYQLSRPPAPKPARAVRVVAVAPAPKPQIVVPPAKIPAPEPELSAPKPAAQPALSARERLAEEVRHLALLRRLATSDPGAAVRMADEGHSRFKSGQLYQEREAVAITALARAGRQSEAQSRATRFLQTFPNSPFSDQVRAVAP